MAYKRKKRQRGRSRRSDVGGGKVRVKGHSRGPRGKNSNKKRVHVKGYRRRLPSA